MKTNSCDSASVKKLTVLLLDHHLAPEKTLRIPKKMLLYWKHYTVAIVGAFMFLVMLTTFFAHKLYELYQDKELLEKQLEFAEEMDRTLDIDEVKDKMEKLETQLESVNAYLKERGLSSGSLEGGKGGEAIALTVENMAEVLDNYSFYLDSLRHDLSNIPLGYPVVGDLTSGYGVRQNPFSEARYEIHPGVDIRAKKGAKVNAPANGTVVFAGWKGGYGNCVIIKHEHGFETLYAHLSRINAKKDQSVKVGEVIGLVGSTGRSTGPHLHYEISRRGKRLNAAVFLKND